MQLTFTNANYNKETKTIELDIGLVDLLIASININDSFPDQITVNQKSDKETKQMIFTNIGFFDAYNFRCECNNIVLKCYVKI